jgi:hypothetical protein
MFCISIPIEGQPLIWTLLYENEDAAKKAWSTMADSTQDVILLADDFGQIARIKSARLSVALFEDLKMSMLAHAQRALHNARTQAKAQQLAANDPVLKAAAMMQGPAVFNPVNGGMPRHG